MTLRDNEVLFGGIIVKNCQDLCDCQELSRLV